LVSACAPKLEQCIFSAKFLVNFTDPPPQGAIPTCSEAGILGAIAGMLETIQAAECLKYITHVGELLTNALLIFNAKTMDFRKVKIHPNI